MQLKTNIYAADSVRSVAGVGQAWIDAESAVTAAKNKLDLVMRRRDDVLNELKRGFVPFRASVPGAYEELRKAIDASLESAAKAEREAGAVAGGVVEGLFAPFKSVDDAIAGRFKEAVTPYFNLYGALVGVEREVEEAQEGLGLAEKNAQEALSALCENLSRVSQDVATTFGAIEELRKYAEQEEAYARELVAYSDKLRGQIGGVG